MFVKEERNIEFVKDFKIWKFYEMLKYVCSEIFFGTMMLFLCYTYGE